MNNRAKEIVKSEIEALKKLKLDSLDEVLKLILNCKGKVVFTGMGKAGLVGKKIAATLSSTGTPALFVSPGEAPHGDLGILDSKDILVGISNSGKTKELLLTMELAKNMLPDIKIIGICSSKETALGKFCDFVLETGVVKEVCPFGLAPTTSTTVMSVIGDILVVMLMEAREFKKEDYAKRHHSGYISELLKNMI